MGARHDVRRSRLWAARRSAIEVVVALAVLLTAPQPAAWAQRPSRDDVQAAYLYNFGKFVRWPSPDSGPIVVCVTGQDPFGNAVAKLVQGEQIDGRPLAERNIDGPVGVEGCSILYIRGEETGGAEAYLAATNGKPILTVGDSPNFLAQGGMIQFVLVGDHVRFSVNLESVNQHRMVLSSELLKVAVAVTGGSGTGGVK